MKRSRWSFLSVVAVACLVLAGCSRSPAQRDSAAANPAPAVEVPAEPESRLPATTESDVTLTAGTRKVVLQVPGMA